MLKLDSTGIPNCTISSDPLAGPGHKNPYSGERVFAYLGNRMILGWNIGVAIIWDAIGEPIPEGIRYAPLNGATRLAA